MDPRSEIRDFLTSRRARITPQDVGLKVFGSRRVPGLRREEVATLAGLSVDYYNRLERGNLGGASDSVLDAVADALRLDEAERAHLLDLARAGQPAAPRSTPRGHADRPSERAVDARLDDRRGGVRRERPPRRARRQPARPRPLPGASSASAGRPANWARFVFLDPGAPSFYADWDRAAKDCVAILRSEAGRNPHDRELSDLVGELATRSEEFRGLWAAHNVRLHTKGVKQFNHPIVGELELSFNRLEVSADPGLMIVAYTAEPGSRSAEALPPARELGSDRCRLDGGRPASEERERVQRRGAWLGGVGEALQARVAAHVTSLHRRATALKRSHEPAMRCGERRVSLTVLAKGAVHVRGKQAEHRLLPRDLGRRLMLQQGDPAAPGGGPRGDRRPVRPRHARRATSPR